MTSTLALILCTLYVRLLLRLEHKQTHEVTKALWIPTVWMLYISSKPLGRWFVASSETPESSPLDRAFLIVLLCLALSILVRRKFDWSRAVKENSWLTILIVYMLVSIVWSATPGISFIRWIREIQAFLMACVVLSEPMPRKAMESILKRSIYILIPFSLLLIKYFPEYGRTYGRWSGGEMWIGVTLQKNGLGRLCLVATFCLLWSLVRRRQGNDPPVWKYQTHAEISVLLISFWLLKGPGTAYSATAITALGVGLLVYAGLFLVKKFSINMSPVILLTVVALIVAFGVMTFLTGGSTAGNFARFTGRDATLTERTEIWAALVPIAMQKPFLGRGFGGSWTPRLREVVGAGEAHSGYLEVLFDLGFVGILLVAAFLLSSCRKAQQELSRDFDWGTLWICILIMATVHNIAESSINSFASQLTAVILFFQVSSTRSLSPGEQYAPN